MRRFKVWLEYPYVGCEGEEEILEFDDTITEEEINKSCESCLETMIANSLDTGWEEVE